MKQWEVEALEKEVKRKFKEPILISVLVPKMSKVVVAGAEQGVTFDRKIMKIECMADFARLQAAIRQGGVIPNPEGWMQVFTWMLSLLDFYVPDEDDKDKKEDKGDADDK